MFRRGDGPDGELSSDAGGCDVLIFLTVPQKQNFLRDQSGMKQQLSTLQQLIAVMDPELYRHFGNLNYLVSVQTDSKL